MFNRNKHRSSMARNKYEHKWLDKLKSKLLDNIHSSIVQRFVGQLVGLVELPLRQQGTKPK